MSRTRRAITAAGFQYAQLTLGLVSGVVLFPLTIRAVGVHDFGLWLATGEVVGYVLLADLGVFGVLPWLVAARDGAKDRPGIARLTADALAVGVVLAGLLAAAAAGVWLLDPAAVRINPDTWAKVRPALAAMLGLSAAAVLVRPFPALLAGLQDAAFVGWVGISQTALTIGLTVGLVLSGGFGLFGLAVATALPPVLGGVASAVRAATAHRYALRLPRPSLGGGCRLVREGFGAWLAGFGVRLLTGSTSLILVGLGRTADATLFAATGKAAQLLQNFAWVLPDSGLVGLSQVRAGGDAGHIRRSVLSLLVMYLLLSGFMAFAVLAANPALVRVWLGPDLYAGPTVNAVIALNLILGAAVTGPFKTVAAVAYRPAVGAATLVFGLLAAGLSYGLGKSGGLAWVAAGPSVAAAVFAVPFGLWVLPKAFPVTRREVTGWWLAWAGRSVPLLAAGAALGVVLWDRPVASFAAAAGLGLVFFAVTRPVVALVPWPDSIGRILVRVRLIPARPAESV
jgi:O-antigen/teichoic acid export membrane protein